MTTEDFEIFYKLYPKKTDRKKAQEKFLKLKKEILPEILKAVKLHTEKN
jgi:hypothetical protein